MGVGGVTVKQGAITIHKSSATNIITTASSCDDNENGSLKMGQPDYTCNLSHRFSDFAAKSEG